MEKIYNPHDTEQFLYDYWEQRGYFSPNTDTGKESFCIMNPPPNITGGLHIGHAFQQVIIDTIIRYQRMQGKNTLWQSGTDHAGIATQMLVEREIANKEGKTCYSYGRDAFIKKIWQWKIKSSDTITHQMRRLGNSIDWNRDRFTLDQGLSCAVKEVFIRLYKEGLIYRGKRLVNWDPRLKTAISDLEVENRNSKSFMWYIRYPLADGETTSNGKRYLVVATTRPETMIGDTGIIVNPKDTRYQNLIGKFVLVPLINRRIPILGDDQAKIEKGTGCVKITPAHDFNDYKVARRHQLPMINIFNIDGNLRTSAEVFDNKGNKSSIYSTDIPIEFQNMDRFTARKAIISAINDLQLLEDIKPYDLIVPYGDRSGVVIEPMLTDQWYVRTKLLAKPAIESVKNGKIRFISKQYENMYFSWMHNIQDWCISRQLWWGHRIPAWYDEQGNVFVGQNEKEIRQENNFSIGKILRQDDDVLDTWFSSSLWTFSTLGWPKNNSDLRLFHPTNVIVSGFDIIFFWIARMIMMTMHFIKDKDGNPQVPFKIVYITGLIRDEQGHKMSKSKGNIIDPLDMIDGISLIDLIEKRTSGIFKPKLMDHIRLCTKKQFPNGIGPHGTDALRFTLVTLASTNRKIHWDMKRLEHYRNFCNKLWNASRFILINTENMDCGFNDSKKKLSLADRWILSEFNQTVKDYRIALDEFRFNIAAGILYEFIWNQFCDWYIELTKPIMSCTSEESLRGTRHTLITVLEALLRLSHPIIPFITEAIWQRVKTIVDIPSDTIMLQPFPKFKADLVDKSASTDIEWLKQVITAVRSIRSEMNISPKKPLKLCLYNCKNSVIQRIKENQTLLKSILHLESITVSSINDNCPLSVTKVIDGAKIFIPMKDLFHKETELERLNKEASKVEEKIKCIKAKLENKNFLERAPKLVIEKERRKLSEFIAVKSKINEQQNIISLM